MDDANSAFNFEKFQPRQTVSVHVPRRGLLRAIQTEIHTYNKKLDGRPTLKLADLASLPDEELWSVRPVKLKNCKISLKEKLVWAKPENVIKPVAIFPIDSPALAAFNLFDGNHELQSIKQTVMNQFDWTEEKAWAYTRGLFLKLVSLQVCVPK